LSSSNWRDIAVGSSDVKKLVEKYREIFDWNMPDIDQDVVDRLILVEVRKALDDIREGTVEIGVA
jgi:hypothetical protein